MRTRLKSVLAGFDHFRAGEGLSILHYKGINAGLPWANDAIVTKKV